MFVGKRNREAGQSTILLLIALSIFLLGAVGLAVDGANLYLNWQMAQAAADAGAQAGVMSIFYGTNTTNVGTGTKTGFSTTAFTCSASDTRTPCYYAQSRNGFNTGSDTVAVDFPNIGDGAVGVNVSRSVSTTLIRFLGPSAATVTARGVAAIEDIPSAIPIIVTHPSLTGALSFNGTPDIVIVGGPRRSIQVNSSDAASIANNACSNATVDLHLAGPNGNGADFGDWGGGPTARVSHLILVLDTTSSRHVRSMIRYQVLPYRLRPGWLRTPRQRRYRSEQMGVPRFQALLFVQFSIPAYIRRASTLKTRLTIVTA